MFILLKVVIRLFSFNLELICIYEFLKNLKSSQMQINSKFNWTPYDLFAPVPCSPSINKSSAYHFGPVRVRILLAQNRVMAEAQVPII